MSRLVGIVGGLCLVVWAGCSSAGGPRISSGGAVDVGVIIPAGSGLGLQHAAQDAVEALAAITRATPRAFILGGSEDLEADAVILVRLDEDADTGPQGYRLTKPGGGLSGVEVVAETEQGAMYGLYQILADLGVRYLHPEETFFPEDAGARLPTGYDGAVQAPAFGLRGFHEHTQHPIPLSDFWLRTDEPAFRDHLTRYLRWLARNRQNAASFMLLKTVDLGSWLPYVAGAIDEAHLYGIQVGFSVSFVDQQQNAFKLLGEVGPGDDDAERIRAGLDELLVAGPDFIVFQIGSSEFTKPDDEDLLGWLEVASAHLAERGVRTYAWIHIICSLKDELGGLFYHLPLQAPAAVGAWVHTVMFYTLTDPAPVYDCEDFGHQIAFMDQADGEREQVFFPESAWWLGFDNNLPLILPITGHSRAADIQQTLPGHQVTGHVTFTSGREWTYWQYDHFLTRITWDASVGWEDYLDWIAPAYGSRAKAARRALSKLTELQVDHFYESNPLIYFYLGGELPQDEIGAQAGILARRPKLAFRDLIRFDDERFAAWQAEDYALLERMEAEVFRLLERMPVDLPPEGGLPAKLYRELWAAIWVYHQRIAHALALYAGAAAVRTWYQQTLLDAPDEAVQAPALAEAEQQLGLAQTISEQVTATFQAMEADYRYPVELLCRPKPESPTAYPYGYLSETSSGFFWTRRDEQLASLIARTFQAVEEGWQTTPAAVFATDSEHIEMLEPDSQMAGDAIRGFIPRLLFGIGPAGDGLELLLAQDADESDLPDPGSEQAVALSDQGAGAFTGGLQAYTIVVYDASGQELGVLDVLEPAFALQIEPGPGVGTLTEASLHGQVASAALVGLVVSVGGIDEEGATALIKVVYGVPAGEALPGLLPFAFGMTFEKID